MNDNKSVKPLELAILLLALAIIIWVTQAQAESAVVMLSDGYLNIRAYPTENSISVGKLHDDDEIIINQTVLTQWVEVLVDGKIIGYCDTHYLRILQEKTTSQVTSCQQQKSFRVINNAYYYYKTDTNSRIGALRNGLVFTGNYVRDGWVECRTSDELKKIYVLVKDLEEIVEG